MWLRSLKESEQRMNLSGLKQSTSAWSAGSASSFFSASGSAWLFSGTTTTTWWEWLKREATGKRICCLQVKCYVLWAILYEVSKYTMIKKKRVHKEYCSYYSDYIEFFRKKYIQHDFGLMPKELKSQLVNLEHDHLRCYCQKDSYITNW